MNSSTDELGKFENVKMFKAAEVDINVFIFWKASVNHIMVTHQRCSPQLRI